MIDIQRVLFGFQNIYMSNKDYFTGEFTDELQKKFSGPKETGAQETEIQETGAKADKKKYQAMLPILLNKMSTMGLNRLLSYQFMKRGFENGKRKILPGRVREQYVKQFQQAGKQYKQEVKKDGVFNYESGKIDDVMALLEPNGSKNKEEIKLHNSMKALIFGKETEISAQTLEQLPDLIGVKKRDASAQGYQGGAVLRVKGIKDKLQKNEKLYKACEPEFDLIINSYIKDILSYEGAEKEIPQHEAEISEYEKKIKALQKKDSYSAQRDKENTENKLKRTRRILEKAQQTQSDMSTSHKHFMEFFDMVTGEGPMVSKEVTDTLSKKGLSRCYGIILGKMLVFESEKKTGGK